MLTFAVITKFIVAHKRAVLITVGSLVLLVMILVAFKSCSPKPKLDEQQIQRAQQAVKQRNDAELKQILVESDLKEKAIDANVANASANTVNAIHEAKQKYRDMNTEELAAELEQRAKQ